MQNTPDFMIIGAMKCATSTLHDQLAQQDGFYMSTPKEPNFFSNDEIYNLGIDWYQNLFSSASSEDIRGESSTHYTKLPTYPETISRINEHAPELKFVYIVRHPIDRLISQYIHEWSQNVIKCDIDTAIDKHPELIEYSLYSMQISPYVELFGKESIHVLFFHQLIEQPQQSLEAVCQHIGYRQHPNWVFEQAPKNISSQRIRKFPLYDLLVDSNIATLLRQNLVPKNIRNRIKKVFTLSDRPEISANNITRLEEIFNDDLKTFGALFDKKLDCKNFNQQF